MTELLKRAFAEAAKLSEEEQDALATVLLEELKGEGRWDDTLTRTAGDLDSLADEALAEHEAGRTRVLDPDDL